jgi:hypothetical protein
MLRRFFIWRAERRMSHSPYRLDRRTYHGRFHAGFFAHLSNTRFWQAEDDPQLRRRRRKRRYLLVAAVLGLLGLAWLVVESARALRLF